MAAANRQQVVISGGQGTLGQAICCELMEHSYEVAAPGRAELDVQSPKNVREYFTGTSTDLLICNAGVLRDELLIKCSESNWDDVWNTNFSGSVRCAEAALPAMLKNKSGHIIFISSFSALHPPVGQSAYAAAKASLIGLTKDLAVRHGSNNIRVNAILPGFMETKMTDKVSDERKDAVKEMHTLGRLNTCSEVAKFIRFIHEELPHTSGQVFQLDSRLDEW